MFTAANTELSVKSAELMCMTKVFSRVEKKKKKVCPSRELGVPRALPQSWCSTRPADGTTPLSLRENPMAVPSAGPVGVSLLSTPSPRLL